MGEKDYKTMINFLSTCDGSGGERSNAGNHDFMDCYLGEIRHEGDQILNDKFLWGISKRSCTRAIDTRMIFWAL